VSDPLTVPTREGLSLSCSAMKRIVQEAEEAKGESRGSEVSDSGRLEQKQLGLCFFIFFFEKLFDCL